MFAVSYLATALLCQHAGPADQRKQALAEQRGEELANLAEVNELVIRRMRTGVLVVDGDAPHPAGQRGRLGPARQRDATRART